jgi:hypothetical protein
MLAGRCTGARRDEVAVRGQFRYRPASPLEWEVSAGVRTRLLSPMIGFLYRLPPTDQDS